MKLLPLAALVVVLAAGCSNSSASDTTATGDTRSAALKFADCMRTNAVKDFPDPDSSGTYTIDGLANDSRVNIDSPAWDKAELACHDLQPAGFTGTKRNADQQAGALEFAQCIRENGVKDFPDPEPDAPMVDTRRIPSTDTKAGMAALNAAMATCGKHAERAGISK